MKRGHVESILERNGAVLAFFILLIGSMLWKPNIILQPEAIRNLLNQNAGIGILSLGMTLVIVAGGIDLSVGSLMALCGVLGVQMMNQAIGTQSGDPKATWVAAGVCLAVGASAGAVNGLLITTGRIAPFIVTLAGLVGFRSMALAFANGGEVRASGSVFSRLGQEGLVIGPMKDLLLHWPIFLFFGLAIVFGFVLNRTPFGRYCIAVGANEQAARYSAINTNRIKLGTYVIVGLCAGLAALCISSRVNSVTSGAFGQTAELDAIAAVVIGGARMSGGYARIVGTVFGVLTLGIITNILTISDVSVYWQGFVKGVIILVAVLIQRGRNN
jgi:ribose transport system permease protein